MSDFVNPDNTTHRPTADYGQLISEIKKDAICPFCPEGLAKYRKNPTIKDGKFWALSNNAYPYENSKYHILLIHKAHIESIGQISPEAWLEIKEMIQDYIREKNIPGGTFFMRFGDTAYTGASVAHLHANFVSSHGNQKDRKPILARIG
jgi:ATP adenylyltransferase